MSQEQPRRPQEGQDPIKYGDVYNVSGDLAKEPVAPADAAKMQSAESRVLGQTQPGGAASPMQSAAQRNEQAGLVGHQDVTGPTDDRGVAVTEIQVPGEVLFLHPHVSQIFPFYKHFDFIINIFLTLSVFLVSKVVGQYVPVPPATDQSGGAGAARDEAALTIGEALEATAHTVGDKPVEQSDAAAIQAAEMRATRRNEVTPGGVAAMAQSAAAYNAGCDREEDKIKLSDVLLGATAKLPADKAATRQDAEGVVGAELRNNPTVTATPGGVAASVATAARLNENVNNNK